jgi:hypothetical protein
MEELFALGSATHTYRLLHTPHVPPFFAQFLHARQGGLSLDNQDSKSRIVNPEMYF